MKHRNLTSWNVRNWDQTSSRQPRVPALLCVVVSSNDDDDDDNDNDELVDNDDIQVLSLHLTKVVEIISQQLEFVVTSRQDKKSSWRISVNTRKLRDKSETKVDFFPPDEPPFFIRLVLYRKIKVDKVSTT